MKSVDYKCLNCNAPLKYNPSGKNWKCEYCASVFTKSELAKNEEKFKETDTKKTKYEEELVVDEYTCQNCGAKIVADPNTAATFCVYCKNTAILKSRLDGKFAPKRIIPFAKTKKEAIKGFTEVCKGKLFLPGEFALEKNINDITGVYIPFFLHSCDLDATIKGKGIKIKEWRAGDVIYTKTDTYAVEREGTYSFKLIPVDGSVRFDDAIMNSIEPFNYDELIDFGAGYLSGFLAEKYDIEMDVAKQKSLNRAENSAMTAIKNSALAGYTTFNTEFSNIKDVKDECEYVLLPVWMLNIKYNGKMYPFAMNGQTGKMIGNFPYSKGKAFLWFMIIFVIVLIISLIVTYIL